MHNTNAKYRRSGLSPNSCLKNTIRSMQNANNATAMIQYLLYQVPNDVGPFIRKIQ